MNVEKLANPVGEAAVRPQFSLFWDRLASIKMSSHKPRYLTSVPVALAVTMLLASCSMTPTRSTPSTVDYRDEAGGVLLSVNSVSRWEQVADVMQPKFNLANGDAALSKVLPVTARIQQQILDAFGVSLGLGANTKTGVAPTVSSGTPAGGEFPSGAASGGDLGLDPLLQYRAAASLYQAVQLINREVEHAAKRKGYIPYMVRMQLAAIPYRRHLPYDVHAQVEFFPSERMQLPIPGIKLPYVVPLIVTDDLEQAIKSRAAEVARQLGLAVNLMVHGVGGNIGANAENRDRESVMAPDVNSLLTVARLNDNGIYIRLGAANEATGGNSLVGRTYDITLLLLVPEAYFRTGNNTLETGASGSSDSPPTALVAKGKNLVLNNKSWISETNTSQTDDLEPPTLSVITHTDFRDTSSGVLLKERQDLSLVGEVDSAFERTLRIRYPNMFAAWSLKTQDEKLNIFRRLVGPIQTSTYEKFYDAAREIILRPAGTQGKALDTLPKEQCAIRDDKSTQNSADNDYRLACINGGYLHSLWAYLASTMVESATKSASFELPVPPDIVIPKQTALMRDDGKEKLDIVLRNVSGITAGGISAVLQLMNSTGKSYEFPAETIGPDPATGTLALQFPSPAKWKLGKIVLEQSHLYVQPSLCTFGRGCATDKIADHAFDLLLAEAPSAKPKAGFDFRASTNKIEVAKGAGTVKLVFDNFKDDSAVLTWSGAEVKSAKDPGGAAVAIALDKITVKAATVLTLEIQNANPDDKVTFKAVGWKNGKETGDETKDFSVIPGK